MKRNRQSYADEVLSDALAVGKTVAEAARAAGISERTAYRRMKDPAVRARVSEVRGAALAVAHGKLNHGMAFACDQLTQLVGNDNPHVQIRAAKTVIQLALQLRKDVDVEDRLHQLEEQTRLPPVVPVFSDQGPGPAALGPCQGPLGQPNPHAELGCPTGLPHSSLDQPEPIERARSPVTGERSPAEYGTLSGKTTDTSSSDGPDAGEPVANPARPPSPNSPGQVSRGTDGRAGPSPHRQGPDGQRRAVAVGLLILAGLLSAPSGSANARPEHKPAADHGRQTCQNLTKPDSGMMTAPDAVEIRGVGRVEPSKSDPDLTPCKPGTRSRSGCARPEDGRRRAGDASPRLVKRRWRNEVNRLCF